ncbi:alpha/beta hydrolase [Microbacterium sp. YY-01]|uniref:alpha/beta hydrolase n=1 Tax=Microbacterium sp. YY-01 TaxID=3421634 RepID=UPI003D1757EF
MALTSPNYGYPLERIVGDAGSMAYWAGVFERLAARLTDLKDSASQTTLLDGRGKAVSAARRDARSLRSVMPADISEAELLQSVLEQYADAYNESAVRANGMIGEIEDAHAQWRQHAATAAGESDRVRWLDAEHPDAEKAREDAQDAIAVRDAARARLDALWEEYERYYSAWDAAYDRALSMLAEGQHRYVSADGRDLLDALLAADTPEEVYRLWRDHPELHDELARVHPEIIGNLDGIPLDVRADANYEHLRRLHEAGTEEPVRSQIDAIWQEMGKGPPVPRLVSFDPDGSAQVTAAIAYGDIENATDVSVFVPGMNSNVRGMGDWGMSARDLNDHVGPGSAAIVWFGYDSPNIPEEPFMDRAIDGAAALRGFLLGLDSLYPRAEVNVIAHSYGSTMAALAIGSAADGLGVDRFIVAGSAGFPDNTEVLENLRKGTQIFATIAHDDGLARFGRDSSFGHGVVPETLPGTTLFDSDGGYDRDGNHLNPSTGHGAHYGGKGLFGNKNPNSGYFMPGTESFYNIKEIIRDGRPGTVSGGEGSKSGFWDLPDWMPFDPYRF